MANRYDRERGRQEDRGYGGGRYGQESSGGSRGDYGSRGSDFDRERNFGGGRSEFGEGSMGSSRNYGSYSGGYGPDYGEGGSRGRDFGGTYRPESEGYRDDYSSGYGTGSSSRSRYGGRYDEGSQGRSRSDRGDYGGNYFGYGGAGYYGSDSPQSERGYMSDRGGQGDDRGWLDRASDEVSSWFGDEEAARRRRMDAREGGGEHRGRGPRNYTRSDDRIREDINDELTDSWTLDASEIEVEVSNGDVVLTGIVNSRYEKRQAEDLAEDVSGVKNVENRIRVQASNWSASTRDTDTGTAASDQTAPRSRTATGNK